MISFLAKLEVFAQQLAVEEAAAQLRDPNAPPEARKKWRAIRDSFVSPASSVLLVLANNIRQEGGNLSQFRVLESAAKEEKRLILEAGTLVAHRRDVIEPRLQAWQREGCLAKDIPGNRSGAEPSLAEIYYRSIIPELAATSDLSR